MINPDVRDIPNFIFSRGIRYRQNGLNPLKDVGSEVYAWGTPLPPAQSSPSDGGAATGSVELGTYLIHVVGENILGNKGLPFDTDNPASVTIAADTSSIVVGLPTFSDPQVKRLIVYRTRKDETFPFYEAGFTTNGSASIILNGGDNSLALDSFLEAPDVNSGVTNALAGPFKYKQPPAKLLVEIWDGRAWTAGERPYDVGTFSATSGSDVFTGNALVMLNSKMIGKGFRFDNESLVYTIEEILNDTQFRAFQEYVTPPSGTDAAAETYQIVGDRNSLRFSEANEVEYWPEENELVVGDEDGSNITAIKEYLDSLLVFTESKIFVVHRTRQTATPYGRKQSLSVNGAISHRSVVKTGLGVFFFGGDAFYRFNNMVSEEISIPLGDLVKAVQFGDFVKGMELDDRIYWFCSVFTDYLDTVFVLDLESAAWDVWRDLRVIDANVVTTTDGDELIYFNQKAGDGYGLYTFRQDALNDGAWALDLSGTVTGATLNTLTDTAQTFQTTGVGNAGMLVRIRSGAGAGQERRIFSNTADTLTLELDWTTVPAAGDTYTMGAIVHEFGSGQLDFGAPQELKTVKHLEFGMGG